ncbi:MULTISPECIES: heavy-metal-associated domain-containing protein [unclassified Campylobacter]|uniref:heavy-metal-associated domain-containing protein n=1 Tax=unclassified Campylobacter TaxID=2593542 RepID=UPI0022E9B9C2|nr:MULTISPECIES: heavy metal-associated domain-containing protein [unclassified Campylobacter]MDA3053990.1 heavy-metal-associated domain-containing protein [Campylobacter sp. VBCF_07 NA4]MDA3060123.1 heavy-metal-associated domain-containing protein [Campylobacter sp. VBCF_02 NA5]MDA3069637.1 heavy-metal-associated domain-containing protein [Campylobacter sp. VBCF_08 NA3]WBR55029.1 heavy metal-associated domain-containing protein [Campylobacter sp. VBCF_01 NA2]
MRKILVLSLVCGALFAQREIEIQVGKIHCNLCAASIKFALQKCEGVISVEAKEGEKKAVVIAEDSADTNAMIEALKNAKYEKAKILSIKQK